MRFVSDLFVVTAWLVCSFPSSGLRTLAHILVGQRHGFGLHGRRITSFWLGGLGTDNILAVSAISKINDLYFTVKDFPLHLQDWHMHI